MAIQRSTCLTMATHHNFGFILEDGPSTECSLSDDHDDVVPLEWTPEGHRGASGVRKSRCPPHLTMCSTHIAIDLSLTGHIATNQ